MQERLFRALECSHSSLELGQVYRFHRGAEGGSIPGKHHLKQRPMLCSCSVERHQLEEGLRGEQRTKPRRVSPMDHGDGNAPAATEGRSMVEEQAFRATVSVLGRRVQTMRQAAGEAPSTVLCPDVLTCFREKKRKH